ncbi:TPA: acylphosphatase [archaeon]|jgi:acylphosphatase|uniref:acylphosphatase n=1 Tax=Candidatus Undinarchaeum marinum TaxID=2756141 RepID=A0A832XIX6_9ARCH|nr:acylphosphatase [Candidatus Undinarchaeum marinum]
MKRVHLFISGKVQGVYFRTFVKENAERIGVKGWVRNTEDKVEAVAEGNDNKVSVFIEVCKDGPTAAVVEKVEVKTEDYAGEFSEFGILR